MKHGHLTEQRKHFVEAYCRLGNGTLAAKEAGYKDSPSLVNQASKLKRELSSEIAEELTANLMSAAPKALSILMDLAENSASDSVKFQASKDLEQGSVAKVQRLEIVLSLGEKILVKGPGEQNELFRLSRTSRLLQAWSLSKRPNGCQANWWTWQQPIRTASPVPATLPVRIASI